MKLYLVISLFLIFLNHIQDMSEKAIIIEWLFSRRDLNTAPKVAEQLRRDSSSRKFSLAQKREQADWLSEHIEQYRKELETKIERLKIFEKGVSLRSTVSCYTKLQLTDKIYERKFSKRKSLRKSKR